jgi:hypothetical protein
MPSRSPRSAVVVGRIGEWRLRPNYAGTRAGHSQCRSRRTSSFAFSVLPPKQRAFGSYVGGHGGCEQPAEMVKVCSRSQMKLDPVPPGRVMSDSGISAEALPDSRPPGPRDPQVNHARDLQMRDFPADDEQGLLITIARALFHGRARREHGDDESLPEHVTLVIGHSTRIGANREPNSLFTLPPLWVPRGNGVHTGCMKEPDAPKAGWIDSFPAGSPDKDGLARIVDADGGRDDAENSYYEESADSRLVRIETMRRRFRGQYLRRLRRLADRARSGGV